MCLVKLFLKVLLLIKLPRRTCVNFQVVSSICEHFFSYIKEITMLHYCCSSIISLNYLLFHHGHNSFEKIAGCLGFADMEKHRLKYHQE
jgi:hypothetical protein